MPCPVVVAMPLAGRCLGRRRPDGHGEEHQRGDHARHNLRCAIVEPRSRGKPCAYDSLPRGARVARAGLAADYRGRWTVAVWWPSGAGRPLTAAQLRRALTRYPEPRPLRAASRPRPRADRLIGTLLPEALGLRFRLVEQLVGALLADARGRSHAARTPARFAAWMLSGSGRLIRSPRGTTEPYHETDDDGGPAGQGRRHGRSARGSHRTASTEIGFRRSSVRIAPPRPLIW